MIKSVTRPWKQLQNRVEQGRLLRDPWYAADVTSDDDGLFVVGCGRSGTTLLREMLCRHSAFGGGPETLFFVKTLDVAYLSVLTGVPEAKLQALRQRSKNIVEFASEYYRERAAHDGKPRWIDKTPMHVRALPRILRSFPNARVIHMIRDGRDVACSLRHHPRERVHKGQIVPNRVNRPISKCASRWLRDVSLGRALAGHPRLAEVRYEQLVANPRFELTRLCEFLDASFEPEMLDTQRVGSGDRAGVLINNANAVEQVSEARMGRWERDLAPAERQTFARIAGEMLIALDYASDHRWAAASSSSAR